MDLFLHIGNMQRHAVYSTTSVIMTPIITNKHPKTIECTIAVTASVYQIPVPTWGQYSEVLLYG